MAIRHARPGEVIQLLPAGDRAELKTTTLLKTPRLEVLRMVLPAGKTIPPHRVAQEVVVQCLEGKIAFEARGERQTVEANDLLYLDGGDEHALEALEDSVLLVSILLCGEPQTH